MMRLRGLTGERCNIILIDSAEPDEIVQMLQQSAEVTVMPLNQSSRADYYFGGDDNKTIQFNRVQAGELLGNIDSMEDELRRYYKSADISNMITEGIITDCPLATLTTKQYFAIKGGKISFNEVHYEAKTRIPQAYSLTQVPTLHLPSPSRSVNMMFSYRVENVVDKYGEEASILTSGTSYDVSPSLYYAWLYRLKEAGVATFFTHNYIGTAKLIASVYHNTQRPLDSHNTLNRYYIPRITLGEHDEDGKRISIREQNPFIRALMSLSIVYHLDIGEKKATALYKAGYKTLYDLAYAEVKELCKVEGIGKLTAEKLLVTIGREL